MTENLSQFLAEMPQLESLSKQELVERVQEAERKWLEEQRINMELVYEMETDVQEQKIEQLRQRVAELEKERDALKQQRDELLKVVEHIRRCIPIGGFAQIHDGSATVADMDAAIASVKEKQNES